MKTKHYINASDIRSFETVSLIGQGQNKYLRLSLGKILSLKDILQFLGASLEQIGKKRNGHVQAAYG